VNQTINSDLKINEMWNDLIKKNRKKKDEKRKERKEKKKQTVSLQ
jgi:hypothetical protein